LKHLQTFAVLALFLLPFGLQAKWVFFQNHLHSHSEHTFSRFPHSTDLERSYDVRGIETLMNLALENNVQALAITDHNTIAHWFEPMFSKDAEVVLVPAMEWTNMFGGHATLIGFVANDAKDAIVPMNPRATVSEDMYQDMVQKTHDRNGFVIINHPTLMYAWQQWPNHLYGADAIELNFHFFMRPQATLDWWQEKLALDHKVYLVGGCDYHVGGNFVSPFESINYIDVLDPAQSKDVVDALKQGRLIVLRNASSPKIEFTAYNALGEVYQMGETVKLNALQSLMVQVKVHEGEGHTLHLWTKTGEKQHMKISSNDFKIFFPYVFQNETDFIRFEIRKNNSLEAVTNPLFVQR